VLVVGDGDDSGGDSGGGGGGLETRWITPKLQVGSLLPLFSPSSVLHSLYSCQSAHDLRRRIRVSVPAIFIRIPSLLSAKSPLDHRI